MMKMKIIFLTRVKRVHLFSFCCEDMLQVGKIALMKANDPVHFFYVLYLTKEQVNITEIVKDDYSHKYHSGKISGKYLEIFKEDKTLTKYVDQ